MLRLLLFFAILPWLAQAQPAPIVLEACVIDAKGNPVVDANITIAGNFLSGTSTNKNGCFQIKVHKFPLTLQISHLNFEMLSIPLVDKKSLEEVLVLDQKIQALPDVTVRAEVQIEKVYQEPYSVVDYYFYKNHLVLLAHKNHVVGYSLILLNEEERAVYDFSLKGLRPKNLYQSCDGKLYLMTNVSVKEILIEAEKIVFGKSFRSDHFSNGWATCVLANDSLAFFKRYYYQGQALQYTGIYRRKEELERLVFPRIIDEINIDLLIEESGLRMPWSGDVWEENVSLALVVLREGKYYLEGMQSIFFPPLYAPLFPKDSMVCIFNHLASQMEYYSPHGDFLFPVEIDYHQRKKWKKKIYFDPYREAAYTSYDTRYGVRLHAIDMETGALGQGTEIPMDFIEKVKVWNGHFYYLYRNSGQREFSQKLYRLRLN